MLLPPFGPLRSSVRPRRLGQRFVYRKNPAPHALAVKSVDCVFQFPFFVQYDESETARLSGRSIANNLRRFNLKSL